MTNALLNRETAAKLAAEYYLKSSPRNPIEGIDYEAFAKKLLNSSDLSISQKHLIQTVMIYAGLEWNLYTTENFEEQLQSKALEWLATP